MKNKKANKIITISVIVVLVVVAVLVFALNTSIGNSGLTIIEKKWINDNANKVVDVTVFNDIPIYGNGGKGVVFDFLDKFSEEYNIEFNKNSYTLSNKEVSYGNFAFKILNNEDKLSDNQILFYEDTYVIVGSNEEDTISSIDDIKDSKVGILTSDKNDILYYLDINSDNVTNYDDIDKLIQGYNDKEVSYLVIPNVMYMQEIVKNNLSILYHIGDISKKYVLEVTDNDLYSIISKFYLDYKDKYLSDSYSTGFLDAYFDNSSYTDVDRVNYNSSVYTYGYVVDMPFENADNDKFVGIISNYLKEFQSIANVELKVVRYNNISDLKQALINGDIDFAFGNFDLKSLGSSFYITNNVVNSSYVVLAKEHINIGSLASLKKYEVSVVENSKLDEALKLKGINATRYSDTDSLLRGIKDNDIILIDKEMYNYYSSEKLSDYMIVYEGSLDKTPFVISGKNKTFASLFDYYVSMTDYNDFSGKYNTSIGMYDGRLKEIISILVFSLAVLLILIIILLMVKNKNKKKKRAYMEDKMKFIDVMTSLKNRNYLNYSIPKWDDNVIYPQAIVVIDLNNLKDINDNYGHEKGDEVIKKAANILIANQLEKTDLVRTDGNEFLIYMVGYPANDVMMYSRKIYKEFKNLPYGYGASIGYSMIEDDVKSIDDAINEAVIDMRKNKENEKK
jgi:diguanylate cyclase (GGDEF)-like protein